MNVASINSIILYCILLSFSAAGQVRRPLIIGRNSGNFILENGQSIRIFGFTNKLSNQLGLPGTTIEAHEGESLQIDFWNVSQGDPHDIQIKGIEIQKQNQRLAIDADKGIRHMEHGYYDFVANHSGTYIYYSPVNYPFDLQAGMFGILIVKPKQGKDIYHEQASQERLWCSFEIDTTWHTDSLLDEEKGENPQLTEKLAYHPQYFLVNEQTSHQQLPGTLRKLTAKLGETVLIRLANTGLMEHRVTFPKEIVFKVITKNAAIPTAEATSNTLLLKPMETYEIFIRANTTFDGEASYAFSKEGQDKPVYIKRIPISISK